MNLKTPLTAAGHMYKTYAKRLEKLGIVTLEDLLYHIPFRYEDYSLISKIASAQPGEIVTIQGTVIDIKNEYRRKFKTLQKANISDGTGTIEVTWFNQPYLTKVIQKGGFVSLSGKVDEFLKKPVMQSPEYELISQNYAEPNAEPRTIHTGRLVPIYPETKGVSSKWLRRQIYKILSEHKQNMFEYLPDSIINNNGFAIFPHAIEQIHFPKSIEETHKARFRLSFDELFLLQLTVFEKKRKWQENVVSHPFSVSVFKKQIEEFFEKLPFTLTNAQKKAVQDIFKDLASKKPMNRLLEGDVGSGKTVVSAIAMFLSHLNGFQSALMAPTEILAKQHFNIISNLLTPMGVRIDLVTGSKKTTKNQESRIKNQEKTENKSHDSSFMIHNSRDFDILVGTHALLSEKIIFQKLGLVVIDEQQRFGVEQRAIIRQKGKSPHLLTMTATPIPRTIALTLYGDLDLSYLDEMPIGRKLVKTWLVPPEKRMAAYQWIEKEIKSNNSQTFIICPFIEESESMQSIKAAKVEFERLQKNIFPNLKLALLHGKQKTKEKDETLQNFRDKKFHILVATPVVEVGIDIKNATIMLIEASDRFGLAQLHQLRGRVGRGEQQSYCLLFTESKNEHTLQRLKAMEKLSNGAELAELDLKLRGPGEAYGTMQHGKTSLKIAHFSQLDLIEKAKTEAEKIFPKLQNYPLLLEKLKAMTIQQVSPD